MFLQAIPTKWLKFSGVVAGVALLGLLATISIRGGRILAQDFPAAVGRIEGDDVEVATTTASGNETNAAPTAVVSGSDVMVRSGHAQITLDAGGEISICGPARFKVIKSSGALTLALDYGRVHPSLESSDTFTIYTPTIVATPIAISGGRRDITLGLEQNGEMCVLTARGAMRVEPQFSDQSLIVPQGGTASLVGGQIQSLHADISSCSCDFPRAAANVSKPVPTPQPPPSYTSIGALTRPRPQEPKISEDPNPPSAPAAEPVYTVLMPPLTFNANSPEPPPDPDPETIMLVREIRLHPTTVARGHVNPAPTQAAVRPVPPPALAPSDDRPPEPQPNLLDRVVNFFRRLTSTNHPPCAGAGCNG